MGVQSVLRSWGAEEHLTNGALFHSIYGTEGFQGFSLPLSHRTELATLIGPKAERLAWIFCMVDRASVDETVLRPQAGRLAFRARAELGAFEIPLRSEQEWLDFEPEATTAKSKEWKNDSFEQKRKSNEKVIK